MTTKYIAKPDTWYKAGTEAVLLDYLYGGSEGKVGLFKGLRINEGECSWLPIGYERVDDEEVCFYDEFDIIEENKETIYA